MRILLDFHADPNVVVGKKSLLAIASHKGYPEAIKLLLDAGAVFNRGQFHPLLEVLSSGNREAFAILIQSREKELPFLIIDQKLFIIHAIQLKTMLLPIIAAIIKKETEEALKRGENNVPPFPPIGLTNPEKKRLQVALEVKDSLISIEGVKDKVKRLKSPWSARGIDEFECLEASYAGGDTVIGEPIINGGDLLGLNDNNSLYKDLPIDPNLDAISLMNRPIFEDSEEDLLIGPPK